MKSLIRKILLVSAAACLWLLCSAALAGGYDLSHCPKCGSANFNASTSECVAPTCTKDGVIVGYCPDCSSTVTYVEKKTVMVKALGHNYGDWSVGEKATCTKDGTYVRTCKRCNRQQTDTKKASGHLFGQWSITQQATCVSEGLQESKCVNCGAIQTQVIPMSGHAFSEPQTVMSAGRLKHGIRLSTCTVCGFELSEQFIPDDVIRRRGEDEGENNPDKVEFLQGVLNEDGSGNLIPDGVYGPETEEAVKEFEKKHGFEQDGIMWDEVYAEVVGEYAKIHGSSSGSKGGIDVSQVQGPFTIQFVTPSTGRTLTFTTNEHGVFASWPEYDGGLFFMGWLNEEGVRYYKKGSYSEGFFTKDTVLTADEWEWDNYNTIYTVRVENYNAPDFTASIDAYVASLWLLSGEANVDSYTLTDRALQKYDFETKTWCNVYGGTWDDAGVYRLLVTAQTRCLVDNSVGRVRFGNIVAGYYGTERANVKRLSDNKVQLEIRFTTQEKITNYTDDMVLIDLDFASGFYFAAGMEYYKMDKPATSIVPCEGAAFEVSNANWTENGKAISDKIKFERNDKFKYAVNIKVTLDEPLKNDTYILGRLDGRYVVRGYVSSYSEGKSCSFNFYLGNAPGYNESNLLELLQEIYGKEPIMENEDVRASVEYVMSSNGFEPEVVDKIIEKLAEAQEEYVVVWLMGMYEYRVVDHDYDGTSFYRPSSSNIYLMAEPLDDLVATFFHESSHSIDDHRSTDDSIINANYISQTYTVDSKDPMLIGIPNLIGALKADVTANIGRFADSAAPKEEYANYNKFIISAKYTTTSAGVVCPDEYDENGSKFALYKSLVYSYRSSINRTDNDSIAQDVTGGMSNNTIRPGCGHFGKNYWYSGSDYSSSMTGAQNREAWAEYMAAYLTSNTTAIAQSEEFFPRACKVMDEIVISIFQSYFTEK